jgi:hypothetical protein
VVETTVSGVPQIVPLNAPKFSPDGNVLSKSQLTTSPPVFVAVIGVIALPLVKVYELGE